MLYVVSGLAGVLDYGYCYSFGLYGNSLRLICCRVALLQLSVFVFDLVIAFRIVGCGLVCLFDWLGLDLVADWV